MAVFDQQSFDYRSYAFNEKGVALKIAGVALKRGGAVDPIANEQLPVELSAKDVSLEVFEALEDHRLEYWQALLVEVKLPGGLEGEWYAQVICEDTRFESVSKLQSDCLQTLEIPVGSIRSTVTVRAVAVDRNVSFPGLVVAKSPDLFLRVDRPPLLSEGGIQVQWSRSQFEDAPGALSFLDVSTSQQPVLYLNDRIQDFRTLLKSHKRGIVGKLRQYAISQIEADTWFALARNAAHQLSQIEGLRLGDEDLTDDDFEELLDGQFKECLRQVSVACGFDSPGKTILETARKVLDPEWHELVRLRIQHSKKGGALGNDLAALIQEAAKAQ